MLTRVWLPDSLDNFGTLPSGIEADVWTGGENLPDSAGQVEYVVLPFGVKPEVIRKIAALPSLKTIQILSAGADHILPYIPSRIMLCNARGAHTASTAEWTVGAMIASIRNFPHFAVAQRDGRWDAVQSEPVGGKHVLIVGYGDIGAAVERRLAGWDVTVGRVARHARDGVHAISELPGLLPNADVVVILLPVTDETRQLVNKDFLRAMKDGALLVNAARGVIIDTDALLEELNSGRIRAALDVTDPEPLPDGHPLWSAPNLLLTPHVAGSTEGAWDRAWRIALDQIEVFADGGRPPNLVAGPD
jgi:phosphoglycerate dehydrogenase-like enzyme